MTTLLNLDRGIQLYNMLMIWVHQLARWDLQKHLAGANGKDLKVSKIPNHNRERFVAISPGFQTAHLTTLQGTNISHLGSLENYRLKSAGLKGKSVRSFSGVIFCWDSPNAFSLLKLFVMLNCFPQRFQVICSRSQQQSMKLWSQDGFLVIDKVGCEMECEIKIFFFATKKSTLN